MAKPTLMGLLIWLAIWVIVMEIFPNSVVLSVMMIFAGIIDYCYQGK